MGILTAALLQDYHGPARPRMVIFHHSTSCPQSCGLPGASSGLVEDGSDL